MTIEQRTDLLRDTEILKEHMSNGRSLQFLERQAIKIIEKYSLKNYDSHISSSAHDTDEFIHDCKSILLSLEK